MKNKSIVVIGSCRIHDPLALLAEQGHIDINAATIKNFTHSAAEAAQRLEYIHGKRDVPTWLHPYVFGKRIIARPKGSNDKNLENVTHTIVEISTLKDFRYQDYLCQINFLRTELLNKAEELLKPWYSTILRGERFTEEQAKLLLADPRWRAAKLDDDAAQLLTAIETKSVSPEQLILDVQRIRELAPGKLILVSHFNTGATVAEQIPARRALSEALESAAHEVKASFLDPTVLVAKYGRAAVIASKGTDVYHYEPEMLPTVAAHFLSRLDQPAGPAAGPSAALKRASVTAPPTINRSTGNRPTGIIEGRGNLRVKFHGTATRTECPICDSSELSNIFRVPLTKLKQAANFDGHMYDSAVLLKTPFNVYGFDLCHACETIFLNPDIPYVDAHAVYQNDDHYVTRKDDDGNWDAFRKYYRMFEGFIPEGSQIFVDAACGIGRYGRLISQDPRFATAAVHYLEASRPYVQFLKEKSLSVFECNLDTDPVDRFGAAGKVDFIIFSESFEHMGHPLTVLRKLVNLLRPGGRLFFTAQCYSNENSLPIRPGEPIYVGTRFLTLLPEWLPVRIVDVKTTSRFFVILERTL